uniref:Uncharacterized protein n=1 Tax=Meloidogyne javanica TaxID=6303 RepID=A0A915MFQ7_MELJA
MGRRPKNKKRLNMSRSSQSYSIYIEKLKLFVERERGKNNCNQKIDKDLNPNEEVQKQLVEYYENTNEQFAKALKLIKNRSKACISILDRTNDIQLNKLHKQANEENQKDSSEESMEANSDEEIKLQTLEEQNNNSFNFQPIQEEEEDDYWIKWNLETMEEFKDNKLKKD